MPCVAGFTGTCTTPPQTTQTYDAGNRPLITTDGGTGIVTKTYVKNDVLVAIGPAPAGENIKQKQYEYDGLGRLVSVCEVTSASGSGSCGQANPQNGFLTTYAYDALGDLTSVHQNAQGTPVQTRSYSYDGLGRLTSENNPESGTTSYTYDSVSSTGCTVTSAGDLVKKTDANGNWLCNSYSHDPLHRLTDVTNNVGGTANPCKRFRYDNTTGVLGSLPTGVTVSYPLGHVVEAATDTCSSPITSSSMITDEWSSYSKRGELTDLYESTPHSGGFYHTTVGYLANGALQSLTGVAQQGTYNYGVDQEGRLYSATQGTNNFVTSTTYNAGSQPLTVSLKAGDSDNYSYDSNTGRMTNFTFTVGSTPKSMVGGLTWNANGTLRTLQITDGFNSAGNQTCNFGTSTTAGYDDLGRLVSANCGSVWSQTFSYDPFGNITKSGTSAWMPGYNQSTNHYALGGTTYDADGNLLTDTFHSYTWNVYGRPASIDSTTLTYDAFDQMVEKNASGTYSEIEYSPIGKVAVMNGRTQLQAYVPLPGGEILSPGPDTFWHVDWLGSVRLASSASQRTITFDRAFAPFGETYNTVIGGTSNPEFASLTQDTVSGEYDAEYRQYHPGQSRWISPDPAGLDAVDATNPQSWNRYSYVVNNPLALTDPSGLDPCNGGGSDPWAADLGAGGTYNGGFSYMPDGGCISDSQAAQWFENSQNIFEGENSINFPMGSGNVLTDLWQDALGLPTVPCGAQFGPWCDPSMLPNPWIMDATQNQKYDDCANKFENSPDGKLYNFFSVFSPVLGPDGTAAKNRAAAGLALKGTQLFVKAGATNLKRTALGWLSGVAFQGSKVIEDAVLFPAVVAGSTGQLVGHFGCSIAAW